MVSNGCDLNFTQQISVKTISFNDDSQIAKLYYAASILIEVTKQFGDLSSNVGHHHSFLFKI